MYLPILIQIRKIKVHSNYIIKAHKLLHTELSAPQHKHITWVLQKIPVGVYVRPQREGEEVLRTLRLFYFFIFIANYCRSFPLIDLSYLISTPTPYLSNKVARWIYYITASYSFVQPNPLICIMTHSHSIWTLLYYSCIQLYDSYVTQPPWTVYIEGQLSCSRQIWSQP